MDNFNVYKDIKARTDGEFYLGVVGPVRTGKSTFIKRFMELMVLPGMEDENDLMRTKDELPQSAAGTVSYTHLIRNYGSGNSGTTNALRVMGKKAGALVFLGDFFKAIIAVELMEILFSGNQSPALLGLYAGFGVVLGHNLSLIHISAPVRGSLSWS